MNEYIGSDAFSNRFPQPGYLSSAMMMFDRYEHEIAAFQWLEYRLPPEALADTLAAFKGCPTLARGAPLGETPRPHSLAHAAIAFEGNEAQIVALEHLESLVSLAWVVAMDGEPVRHDSAEIMEEFWDRFLMLIIDRNTLVLS